MNPGTERATIVLEISALTQQWVRKRSLSGTLWLTGAGAAISIANLGIFVVVARLIQPMEFGIVSFAAVFIEFLRLTCLSVFTDAVIRRPEVDDTTNSTTFWTAMLSGGLCLAVCVLIAAPLAERYYASGSGWIFAVLALILPLEASRCVHEGLLKRSFQYREIAWRLTAATLGGGLLAIPLALVGMGAWALVIQRLGVSALQLVISWRVLPWRPAWRFSVAETRTLLRFCSQAGSGRVLLGIGERVPEAIIGAFTGPEALAYYRVGARGLDSISQLAVQPPASVALSALSRVKPEDYEAQFLRILRLVSIIAVPAYFGAGVLAPEFVQLMFGPKWDQSAVVMSCLALAAAPCIMGALIGPLLLAAGHPRLLATTALANICFIGGPVLVASFISLPAVAVAQLLGSHAGLLVTTAMVIRTMGFSGARLFKILKPPFLAAGSMALTLVLSKHIMGQLHPVLTLMVLSGAGAGLYGCLLLMFARDYALIAWRELDPLLPERLRVAKTEPRV